ncbi:MAG: hypothetical protein WC071_12135, partial [Victivallaceae bacterium]
SKESYWKGYDAIPKAASLSHSSAIALSYLLDDFPKRSGFNYTDADRDKCLNWLKEHKDYKMKEQSAISKSFLRWNLW